MEEALKKNFDLSGVNLMVLWPKAEVTIEKQCKFMGARFSVFPGAYIYSRRLLFQGKPCGQTCFGVPNNYWERLTVFAGLYYIGRRWSHAIFDVNSRKRKNWRGNTQNSIGEHVWVGDRCIVLPDVKTASGSIIGAASTVKKSIPNNSIAVGSPAKVIRKNVAWHREYAEQNIENCPPEYVRLTEEDI